MLNSIATTCSVGSAQADVTPLPAPTTPQARKARGAPRSAALSLASSDAYAKDALLFKTGGGTIPCDAAALLNYMTAVRNKIAPRTLYRRCMAVRHAHISAGVPSPTDHVSVRPLLRLLQLGHVPDRKALLAGVPVAPTSVKRREPKSAAPINRRLLQQILEPLPRNLLDRRDRALLLLGFMGAMNRSALVSLNIGDLRFLPDALVVTVRSARESELATGSGSIQGEAQVRRIAVPATGGDMCAASAVREWVQRAALDADSGEAPLWRRFDRGGDPTRSRLDAASVNLIVKKWVKAAGVDPARYSAHSLVIGRRSEIVKGVL